MSTMLPADFVRCGAGRGAECCAFLVVGSDGAACARFTELDALLRARALAGVMTARRLPTEPYPTCQRDWDAPAGAGERLDALRTISAEAEGR